MYITDCKREEDRHERLARRADMYALTCTVTDEGRPDPADRARRLYLSQVSVCESGYCYCVCVFVAYCWCYLLSLSLSVLVAVCVSYCECVGY